MDKELKKRTIMRLEGEIDACDYRIDYYQLNIQAVKDSKKDYQDELRAVKKGKKYVPNKKRASRWI